MEQVHYITMENILRCFSDGIQLGSSQGKYESAPEDKIPENFEEFLKVEE